MEPLRTTHYLKNKKIKQLMNMYESVDVKIPSQLWIYNRDKE